MDEISPGLRPLVCLAGTLLPFAEAAEEVLQRFAGVRVSASTVLRCTEGAGERLRAQQKEGRMVEPTQPEPAWTAARVRGLRKVRCIALWYALAHLLVRAAALGQQAAYPQESER